MPKGLVKGSSTVSEWLQSEIGELRFRPVAEFRLFAGILWVFVGLLDLISYVSIECITCLDSNHIVYSTIIHRDTLCQM